MKKNGKGEAGFSQEWVAREPSGGHGMQPPLTMCEVSGGAGRWWSKHIPVAQAQQGDAGAWCGGNGGKAGQRVLFVTYRSC